MPGASGTTRRPGEQPAHGDSQCAVLRPLHSRPRRDHEHYRDSQSARRQPERDCHHHRWPLRRNGFPAASRGRWQLTTPPNDRPTEGVQTKVGNTPLSIASLGPSFALQPQTISVGADGNLWSRLTNPNGGAVSPVAPPPPP